MIIMRTYINAPDSTAVKQKRSGFADFPDVREIPHVEAVVVVYARQLIVHAAVAHGDGVGVSRVCCGSSCSSDTTYSFLQNHFQRVAWHS